MSSYCNQACSKFETVPDLVTVNTLIYNPELRGMRSIPVQFLFKINNKTFYWMDREKNAFKKTHKIFILKRTF